MILSREQVLEKLDELLSCMDGYYLSDGGVAYLFDPIKDTDAALRAELEAARLSESINVNERNEIIQRGIDIEKRLTAQLAVMERELDFLKGSFEPYQLRIAALEQQLAAMTQDYEAACHLAESTSKDWQLIKHQLAAMTQRYHEVSSEANTLLEQRDRAVQQLAKLELGRDEWQANDDRR